VAEGDDAGSAVDERAALVEIHVATESARLCGDVLGAPRDVDDARAEVRAAHDVGIEQREQAAEVALARSREERVDDLLSAAAVGIGARRAAPDAAAGAAGELACRLGRAVEKRRDLVERDGEEVVENERHPLARREGLE